MARRLKQIANWINENTDHTAKIEQGYCNTDSSPRGCPYITHKGKGRYGNRLIVKTPEGEIVCDHNSAMTYSYNSQVEDWLESYFNRNLKDDKDSMYRRHYR